MKRVGVGIAVIVGTLTLVTPPLAAQNGSAWLSPKSTLRRESGGEVVLTVSMWRAGRVTYQTMDGDCEVTYSRAGSTPEASCAGDKATAPDDYTATSGELIFTTGGTQRITIPIVDDAVAEAEEILTVAAWEEANADPWIPRGDSVTVRIIDDETEPSEEYAYKSAPSTNTTVQAGRSSGPAVAPAAPTASTASTTPNTAGAGIVAGPGPTTTTTATPPSPGLQVALPEDGMPPAPGFELTGEALEPTPDPGGSAGSSGGPLASRSGAFALALGALAVARWRRLSATQAARSAVPADDTRLLEVEEPLADEAPQHLGGATPGGARKRR